MSQGHHMLEEDIKNQLEKYWTKSDLKGLQMEARDNNQNFEGDLFSLGEF